MTAGILRLEQLDAAAIPAALRSARQDSLKVVAATVACAPDSGLQVRTVRPLSLWMRLIDAAGFDVEAIEELDSPTAAPAGWSIAAHWSRLDPLRGDGQNAQWRLSLRARRGADADDAALRTMLGVRPLVPLPARIARPDTHLVFLIGTYQEFRQYQPLWSHLAAASFTVLLRPTALTPAWTRRADCIAAWLDARGIAWRLARSTDELDWASLPVRDRVLIAGADSTAFRQHLLNAAFVVEARQRGWRTVQLQHGIWPYADVRQPMALLSDIALTWSDEFRTELDTLVDWPDGSRRPRGLTEGVRFTVTGCPGFDRYADASSPALRDMLGAWTTDYRRSVLVATNLHWPQHRRGAEVNPAILALAAVHPETLFVVKLHPVHDVDDGFLARCPDNVVVLDEFCCLAADVDCQRLVLATDAVISTVSTVALEASLARRPLLVLDTDNPNRYQHVETTEPGRLAEAFGRLFDGADSRAFRDHYVAPATLGTATTAVFAAIADELDRPRPDLPAVAALQPFVAAVSTQADEALALEARLIAADEHRVRLEAELEAAAWIARVLQAKDRLQFERRSTAATTVAVFGASEGGRQAAGRLRRMAGVTLACFIDNDRGKWGQCVDGIPVVEPGPDAYAGVDVILPATIHLGAIIRQVVVAGYASKLLLDEAVLSGGAADVEPASPPPRLPLEAA